MRSTNPFVKIPPQDHTTFIRNQFKRNLHAYKVLGLIVHSLQLALLATKFITGTIWTNKIDFRESVFIIICLALSLPFYIIIFEKNKSYKTSEKPTSWLIYLYTILVMLWTGGTGLFGLFYMKGILPYFALMFVIAIVIDLNSLEYMLSVFPIQLAFSVLLIYWRDQIGPYLDMLIETNVYFFISLYLNYYINELHKRNYIQHIKLEKNNEELSYISYYDSLSGLYNRRRWEEIYNEMFNNALEQERLLGVMVIDIDYFKQYNDHYGHVAGDEIIRKISKLFKDTIVYSPNNIGRYGGDEFAVSFLGITEAELDKVVKDIRVATKKLAVEHLYSKTEDYLSLSIGTYLCQPTNEMHHWSPVAIADQELYKEKENRVHKDS